MGKKVAKKAATKVAKKETREVENGEEEDDLAQAYVDEHFVDQWQQICWSRPEEVGA